MDKEKDLERTFTQSMDCPRKLSEEQELNMIIGISVGSVVFIAAVVAFGMWRKNYVKVHTHNETAEEMEARERELEMNGVVVGGASDAGIEEGNGKKHKHKHHHKHKKKHEHKHKHKHKHKDKN
jgi:ABC-type nickel/cobalt efflux system permease component RcnA